MGKLYYIGLMSGTSLDAVDAALVSFTDKIQLLETHSEPISEALKKSILAICYPGDNEIERLGSLDIELGELFAQTCLGLLTKAKVSPQSVYAIGSHGQTIRHRPFNTPPFTLQIGDANVIAARTGITVVADYRRRDIALGGQGAPLAPAFHRFFLHNPQYDSWVLNIGGIANLTWLPANAAEEVIGFDTGPGNTLLDAWHRQHTGQAYDHQGQWASRGTIDHALLSILLDDIYFAKKPPKSSGREYFNLDWLQQKINQLPHVASPVDVQATLTELTAQTITQAMHQYGKTAKFLWVCGGGIKNLLLMQRIKTLAPNVSIDSTATLGIDSQWIEACAFAWLAHQTLQNKPGNLPKVTGASKSSILGAIFPN